MNNLTQEDVAEKLLWGLWRSISDDYKMKYPRDIWEHFENAIRSASYTGNLKGFLTLFQRRLPLDLQVQFTKDIKFVIDAGQDEQVLEWLRTETTYLMMLVRIANQRRKDDFKAYQESISESISESNNQDFSNTL